MDMAPQKASFLEAIVMLVNAIPRSVCHEILSNLSARILPKYPATVASI